MRITKKNWRRDVEDGGGEMMLNLTPEDTDDIWTLYNLISVGDEVECVTMRKVLQENASGAVVDSQKMKMVLAVKVEKMDIDLNNASLRINGKNVKENKHVKLGSYHTLDVEPERWVKVTKDCWDAISVEILEQALANVGKAEIGSILMNGEGLGLVCTTTPWGTMVKERVEVSMPKKKLGPTSQSEKALEKFLNNCVEAMLSHLRFDLLKAVVIGSTVDGLRDELYRRLIDDAQQKDNRSILDNKSKFMRVAISSAQPTALESVLKEPRIANILAETKSAIEARALDSFHKMNKNDAERTTYGPAHVQRASDQCAARHLLLSDSLFRSTDVSERKKYAAMVANVKENGGEVTIFASGSDPDRELLKLSGIAAILHFPLSEE